MEIQSIPKIEELVKAFRDLEAVVKHLVRLHCGKDMPKPIKDIHDWVDKNPQAIVTLFDGTPGILIQYLNQEPVVTDRGSILLLRNV